MAENYEKTLEDFEFLTDAVLEIDNLVDQANKAKGKEKRSLLIEAQSLMNEYEAHCIKGGNDKKQFNEVYDY